MILFVYSLVVLIATFLGSFIGLGGGVIIKPVFDLINVHTLPEIAFLSSCAVFSMSIASTTRHIIKKTPIKASVVLLISVGSVAGGILGNFLFNKAISVAPSQNIVKGFQSLTLFLLLICVILSVKGDLKSFKVKNPIAIVLSGLLLGTTAAFLGIGGGPINVAFLTLMFSFTMKDAAVYSVAIIFFSQLSNIIITYIKTGFVGFPVKILWVIIPCAVIGGLIGSMFNRKCDEKVIKTTFITSVAMIASLSLFNAIIAFS